MTDLWNTHALLYRTQYVRLCRNVILLPDPQRRIEETVSRRKLICQRSPLCRKMRKTTGKLNVSKHELGYIVMIGVPPRRQSIPPVPPGLENRNSRLIRDRWILAETLPPLTRSPIHPKKKREGEITNQHSLASESIK